MAVDYTREGAQSGEAEMIAASEVVLPIEIRAIVAPNWQSEQFRTFVLLDCVQQIRVQGIASVGITGLGEA